MVKYIVNVLNVYTKKVLVGTALHSGEMKLLDWLKIINGGRYCG